MKITLSKRQWEYIGKKSGWMRTAQPVAAQPVAAQPAAAQPAASQPASDPFSKAKNVSKLIDVLGNFDPQTIAQELSILLQDGRTAPTAQALIGQLEGLMYQVKQVNR